MASDLVRRLPTPSPTVRYVLIGGGLAGVIFLHGLLALLSGLALVYGILKR